MRNLLTKKWFALVVFALFFSLLPRMRSVSASPLFAGLCTGTGCRGKDPIAYQCYNVSTISYSYYPNNSSWVIFTELRKSTDCNSFWSRATKSASYSGNWMLSEALECANSNCVYSSTTPPPNPSTYYYYYPWTGNRQTPNPNQASLGYFYSDMVSATKNACARGWTYTSAPSNYVTNSNVYKSWACNQ